MLHLQLLSLLLLLLLPLTQARLKFPPLTAPLPSNMIPGCLSAYNTPIDSCSSDTLTTAVCTSQCSTDLAAYSKKVILACRMVDFADGQGGKGYAWFKKIMGNEKLCDVGLIIDMSSSSLPSASSTTRAPTGTRTVSSMTTLMTETTTATGSKVTSSAGTTKTTSTGKTTGTASASASGTGRPTNGTDNQNAAERLLGPAIGGEGAWGLFVLVVAGMALL